MTLIQAVGLFFAAMIASALNSVAGGGSFISFPALTFTGVPQKNANATNTVALWLGTIASVRAYREELKGQNRSLLISLGIPSFIGGVIGSWLLLVTPDVTFTKIVPFLLLFAIILFTLSPRITKWVRTQTAKRTAAGISHDKSTTVRLVISVGLQLIIATYGGYFGAGIGIMMLAMLGFMGLEDIHQMNGLKTFFASIINGSTTVILALAGKVFWAQALVMLIGALIGGYGGASFARKINPVVIRRFVIVVGFSMAALYFQSAYLK